MTEQPWIDAEAGDPPSTVTISDFFRHLAVDEQGAEARKTYCAEISRLTENLAAWLAVDAWIGAGDVKDTSAAAPPPTTPERRRAFIASSLVAQMSSELINGSVLLLRDGNEYACSGLVRQLIECEYLFRAFQLDFAQATKWLDSPPSAKYDFSPGNLRKIGGFDHVEYSNHCEAGGHPRAGGRHLLELSRLMTCLGSAKKRHRNEVNLMLWMDLALHCDRTWGALARLLSQEHARFDTVRAQVVEEAEVARTLWREADLLARHIGPILGFIDADPSTPLSDLLGSETG